jgi:copper(I)-binding protein
MKQLSTLLATALAVACVAAVAPAAQDQTVAARDAWIRQPIAGRDVTAAYLVVDNHGAAPRAIVGAASDVAKALELHEMKMDNGMMRMSRVERIEVPPHGSAELKPGGFHIMMFGLERPLAAGAEVPLTLLLDDGTKVAVTAVVRTAGAK